MSSAQCRCRASRRRADPNRLRPKRAPSSSAQSTTATVTGGVPSAARARISSTPAITPSAPSSQPPFGTLSRCEPTTIMSSLVAAQVRPRGCPRRRFRPRPAGSPAIRGTAPGPRATPVSMHRRRLPSGPPVRSSRARRSATTRAGSNVEVAVSVITAKLPTPGVVLGASSAGHGDRDPGTRRGRVDALYHADGRAFGFHYTPERIAEHQRIADLSRFRIALDGDDVVGRDRLLRVRRHAAGRVDGPDGWRRRGSALPRRIVARDCCAS